LVGRTADIVHPGKDGDFGRGFGEIAEGEEIGVHGRLGPIEHLEFARLGRGLRRIEAGRGEINNAGEGEVVANDGGEKSGVGFVGFGLRGEVGDGDAGFLFTNASGDVNPVLGVGGRGEEHERQDREQRRRKDEFNSSQASLQVVKGGEKIG
jgi:hypothetical protein